jgi:DNA-directed RNA polymerase subunit F
MKLFKIIYDPVFEPGYDEVNDEKYEEDAMSGGMIRNRSPGPPPPPIAAPALRIPAQAANDERKRRRTAVGTVAEMAAARRALLDGIVAPPAGVRGGVAGGIDAAFAEVVAKVDFRSRGRSLGSRKAPRPRSRARSAPAGAEPAIRAAYATSSSQYASYIDAGKKAILEGEPGNVAETVQQVLTIKKFPAFLGLKRSRWEKPNAGTQCGQVPDPMRNSGKCWLCGNPVPIARGTLPGAPDGTQASVCGPDNNFECEHVLPAPFMFFTKTLINNLILDPSRSTKTLLYDSSCKLCNGIKDNGLYLKASWEGDRLKFEPNNENIIVDILMFLVSTRITKGKEVFTGPLDGRLPPWPGIPTTYGHDNPAIALPAAPNVDWPASALDPGWRRSGSPNDPCGTPWITILTPDAPRCGGEDDEPSDSDSDGGEEAAPAAAAAADAPPDRGQAVHFFSLKRVGVTTRPGCDEKYVKLSVSQQHFTSIATVGERKFHNLARAAVEYASDVAAVDPGVASTLNMDDLTWLVGKNVGVLDLLPISPDWELNLREAAILVSVNNEGSLRAAMKSLQAANIPQDVSRNKAWNWIRGRFEEIHRRMAEVCQYFNDNPVKQREIVASVRSLVNTPVLTVDNFITLNRLPNLPALAGAGGRRLRFTIRRRSETRQTKKNRRRRVIEVRV